MPAGKFSQETVNKVLTRSHARCEHCGRAPVQEIHHRIPRGMGGVRGKHAEAVASPANALGLCRGCHDWAERRGRAEARDMGLILRRTADPTTRPFYSRSGRGSWFLLDENGNKQPTIGL